MPGLLVGARIPAEQFRLCTVRSPERFVSIVPELDARIISVAAEKVQKARDRKRWERQAGRKRWSVLTASRREASKLEHRRWRGSSELLPSLGDDPIIEILIHEEPDCQQPVQLRPDLGQETALLARHEETDRPNHPETQKGPSRAVLPPLAQLPWQRREESRCGRKAGAADRAGQSESARLADSNWILPALRLAGSPLLPPAIRLP